MEVSFSLSGNRVQLFPQTRTLLKVHRIHTISCRVGSLASERLVNNNLYQVLSLDKENAGFDDIKKAYRRMALQYHPDVCPPSRKEESTRRFVELQRAYKTLSDPNSRKMYDYELYSGISATCGAGEIRSGERTSIFSKEVWENQLLGLKRRSPNRVRRANFGYN
ncbi:hypothetical protein GIB67_026044 [Kingdonia uniflora]|uniref:J domain-containing protein n=1 Tax=Kingdonia uniflora TaxID=39325 RepID=A0A7J7M324_9MAGN|nr:hypothetical protein GIB67_026044 [Kingdonia uniflora]